MRTYTSDKTRILARSAKEARNYSLRMRVLAAALGFLIVSTAIIYIVSILYTKYGSFTVTVDKYDSNKYSLTLCETPDFVNKTIRLNAKDAEDVTNISGNDIPADVNKINGVHNGTNYIAYTFYLKNSGKNTVTYEYYPYIVNVTNSLDTAIRIKLFVDDVPTTYARTKTDGAGPESGTKEFLTSRVICRNQIKNFAPKDVTKFTVVIWLEGDDADCVDALIGGTIKVDMTISVVESNGEAVDNTK